MRCGRRPYSIGESRAECNGLSKEFMTFPDVYGKLYISAKVEVRPCLRKLISLRNGNGRQWHRHLKNRPIRKEHCMQPRYGCKHSSSCINDSYRYDAQSIQTVCFSRYAFLLPVYFYSNRNFNPVFYKDKNAKQNAG